MKRIGVIANCTKERSADVLSRLARDAAELGLDLFADGPAATLLGRPSAPRAEMLARSEAVIALGGDGTVLRAVRELGGSDIPVMGVNIGGLGFLTSVAEESLRKGLGCLAADDYEIAACAAAECRVERGGETIVECRALNDVVVTRGASNRVLTLEVTVDGEWVTSYMCDGIIVATPAGSTGHSLSAGGPILTPEASVFVISVICPHTLSSRPLVVPDRSRIEIVGVGDRGELMLAVDGQTSEPLRHGDRVCVTRSARDVRFVRLPGHSYFAVLRHKLGWSGSSAPRPR
ncbi:MAG: hypothetical protein FJ225_10945 [Lentisphaerae bacterium]|nr:hypothetical protein [Lentisphaerota bacterium]